MEADEIIKKKGKFGFAALTVDSDDDEEEEAGSDRDEAAAAAPAPAKGKGGGKAGSPAAPAPAKAAPVAAAAELAEDGWEVAASKVKPKKKKVPVALVFLTGIPGIGKDYVCAHLPAEMAGWEHFSQDQFAASHADNKGRACQQAVRKALQAGTSVILKRNCYSKKDRDGYVALARDCKAKRVAIVPAELSPAAGTAKSERLLQAAVQGALARLLPGGPGHESLTREAIIPGVCSSFFKAFEAPTVASGEMDVVVTVPYLDPAHDAAYLSGAALAEFEEFKAFESPAEGSVGALSFAVRAAPVPRRPAAAIAADIWAALVEHKVNFGSTAAAAAAAAAALP